MKVQKISPEDATLGNRSLSNTLMSSMAFQQLHQTEQTSSTGSRSDSVKGLHEKKSIGDDVDITSSSLPSQLHLDRVLEVQPLNASEARTSETEQKAKRGEKQI